MSDDQVMTEGQMFERWTKLTAETQAELKADPHGHIPVAKLTEIVQAGIFVSGAYWVDSQDGVQGFNLSGPFADFVESVVTGGADSPE